MHRIVVTKKKPVYVSENLALRPATQNSKLIRMIYKQLASLNDAIKNFSCVFQALIILVLIAN